VLATSVATGDDAAEESKINVAQTCTIMLQRGCHPGQNIVPPEVPVAARAHRSFLGWSSTNIIRFV
jgi:hypothetical protein